MSKTKHTPGPWCTNGLPSDFIYIEGTDAEGRAIHIAEAPRHSLGHDGASVLQQVANTDLMAAAPQLLEACELALHDLLDGNTADEITDCECPACVNGVIFKLRAAISKAKGGAR